MKNSTVVINYFFCTQNYGENEKNDVERFSELSESSKKGCRRFKLWQDRQKCFIGRLLLRQSLEKKYGVGPEILNGWHTDNYGKPYIDRNISFNISHSGRFVVCATAEGDVRIGIDIERIKPIDLSEFESILGDNTVREIKSDCNPERNFFRYWTAAESAMKADGRGLFIEFDDLQINLKTDTVTIEDHLWHLSFIDISADYVCCLASSKKHVQLEYQDCTDILKDHDLCARMEERTG
jgi:4'-phosphopantetheinyl transferase